MLARLVKRWGAKRSSLDLLVSLIFVSNEAISTVLLKICSYSSLTNWRKDYQYKCCACHFKNEPPGDAKYSFSSTCIPISGGLGFDFYPKNNNIYLVATEEGFIHKCSCSYNEQYLQTYTGHTGKFIFYSKYEPFQVTNNDCSNLTCQGKVLTVWSCPAAVI